MVKRVKCQMKKNNFWTILFLKTNFIACSNEKIGRNGLIKKKMFITKLKSVNHWNVWYLIWNS